MQTVAHIHTRPTPPAPRKSSLRNEWQAEFIQRCAASHSRPPPLFFFQFPAFLFSLFNLTPALPVSFLGYFRKDFTGRRSYRIPVRSGRLRIIPAHARIQSPVVAPRGDQQRLPEHRGVFAGASGAEESRRSVGGGRSRPSIPTPWGPGSPLGRLLSIGISITGRRERGGRVHVTCLLDAGYGFCHSCTHYSIKKKITLTITFA